MGQLSGIKISAPTYNDVVPSTKQKVKLTPFRVGDEKTLLIASESKDSKQMINALKSVIGNCVTPIDVDSIAPFDLEYLFLKLRSISVGEKAKVGIKCSSCEHLNDIEVEIDKVGVVETEGHNNIIKINEELIFEMKYPDVNTIGDIQNKQNIEMTFELIARSVAKVFYNDDVIEVGLADVEDLKNIINDLPAKNFEEIQNFFNTVPKLKHDVHFKCTSCGTDNVFTLEGLSSFF